MNVAPVMAPARLRTAVALGLAVGLHWALAWPVLHWQAPAKAPEPIMVAVLPVAEAPMPQPRPPLPQSPIQAPPPPIQAPPPPIQAPPPPVQAPPPIPEPVTPSPPPELAPIPPTAPRPAPAPAPAAAPTPVAMPESMTPPTRAPAPPLAPPAAPAPAPVPVAIEPPRYQAAYLDNPQPAYPVMSRKLREQGLVRLRVRVDREGRPETVNLLASSGFARLDEAATRAVQTWRFEPARQGGHPLAAWVEVPIRFNLER